MQALAFSLYFCYTLYMFRVPFLHPSSGISLNKNWTLPSVNILQTTGTGTTHDCHRAACTVFKILLMMGAKGHPKHVECIAEIKEKS
jgi:hypothetical protein